MDRKPTTLSIAALQRAFVDIDFPEYQREPNIWSREQKQRLIDSILRQFDISAVYFYRREDDGLECIDGRQRLNAIMSFLADNEGDEDNGFALRIENEISNGLPTPFDILDGSSYQTLQEYANGEGAERREAAAKALDTIHNYKITTIELSGVVDEEEFNLQFLRLNLGALINAGEKLHAMVGQMHNVIFESDRIGKHPFFDSVRIPTRRYAKELTAAQVLLQAFSLRETGEFARARHTDLQRFVKTWAEIDPTDQRIVDISTTLDALSEGAAGATDLLRNRAVTVSMVLVAWDQAVPTALSADDFWTFGREFIGRLRWQVKRIKDLIRDDEYSDLVDFQRDLTQASVEKPAVARRHEILKANLAEWLRDRHLIGDTAYEERTGEAPGTD